MVSIELSPDQQDAIERITGDRLLNLNIAVERLIDLGDLVAN